MPDHGLLELLVENTWVVETVKALGSGHMLHLSYAYDRIAPETLADLRAGALGAGDAGEILVVGQTLKRVATFELHRVNDLKGFVRLDFRLLSVTPFIRDGEKPDGIQYLCRYSSAP